FCPDKTWERATADSSVVIDARSLRGQTAETKPAPVCVLPMSERSPAAAERHYGASLTRAVPADASLPPEKLQAMEAELPLASDDLALEVARAAIFEKYGQAQRAIATYKDIQSRWADATWTGSRLFVLEEAAPPSP